jgi:predicted metal-binding membrane protein
MSLDQSQRLPAARHLPASTWPILGWLVLYLLIAGAWAGLIGMAAEPQANFFGTLLARCLAPADAAGLPTLIFLWALMSLGMMLPTSLPTLRRFGDLVRQGGTGRPSARFLAFLLAYAAIWLGFSMVAALLQFMLARTLPAAAQPILTILILAGAGLYQFSRLKHACLTRCRHPMTFFMVNWRDGLQGAAAMGLKHGRDCLGCCWALMLLSLIGGAMNLAWMGLGMILMMLEKLAGTGRFVTVPLGLILVAAAGFALGHLWFAA